MNFFSHFVIDHQPGNHAYNTGLLLPDVSRQWIKSFREPKPGFTPAQEQLHLGCLKHYEADKRFHGSSFFHDYYQLLNAEVTHCGLSDETLRKWFISHVMLEMLIDRVLIRAYPQLLADFYRSLELAGDGMLRSFLKMYGMEDDDTFFSFFDHFRKVQYLYFYTDNNKFLYSLNRIMMRVNMHALSDEDAAKIEGVVTAFEEKYFSDASVMLGELKAVFK